VRCGGGGNCLRGGRSAEGERTEGVEDLVVDGKVRRGGSKGRWGRELLLIFWGDGGLEVDPRRGGSGGGITDGADACRDGGIL
jgi:hypothetical protein